MANLVKNSKTLFRELTGRILPGENKDEVSAIAYAILEDLFGLTKTDTLAARQIDIHPLMQEKLDEIITRLNKHEPLQYILGKAFFYGRSFLVNRSVLIPRPETELLISTIENFVRENQTHELRVLDIGTGSGCIAITLALQIPGAFVFASDVSPEALDVAKENATRHKANISLMHHDILKQELPFRMFDIIVSNPPYVTEKEKQQMEGNVIEHEPFLALFVPDSDPLIFYNSIVRKGYIAMAHHGLLAVEINENFGSEVKTLFEQHGFLGVQIIRDVSGKDRVVTGRKT
jgi:release factor glutamine methyltransferase